MRCILHRGLVHLNLRLCLSHHLSLCCVRLGVGLGQRIVGRHQALIASRLCLGLLSVCVSLQSPSSGQSRSSCSRRRRLRRDPDEARWQPGGCARQGSRRRAAETGPRARTFPTLLRIHEKDVLQRRRRTGPRPRPTKTRAWRPARSVGGGSNAGCVRLCCRGAVPRLHRLDLVKEEVSTGG